MGCRIAGVIALSAVALSGCATMQDRNAQTASEESGKSSRLVRLAADLERRGEMKTAIALYERAASLPDAPASAFVSLGDVYARAGYNEEAMKAYRAALSRSPKYGPALVGLGWAMIDQGDAEAGIRTLSEGAQYANTSRAFNRLGVAQTFAGRVQPAMKTFARAQALSPDDPDVKINMALAAALAKNEAKAIPLAQQIARRPEASLQHKRNAILVYGILGRAEQARALGLTGLTTEEIDALLSKARSIGAGSSVKARAEALASLNA